MAKIFESSVIFHTIAFALYTGTVGYVSYNIAGVFSGISRADRISLAFLFGFSLSILFLFVLATAGLHSAASLLTISVIAALTSRYLPSSHPDHSTASLPLCLEAKEYRLPASLLAGFMVMQVALGLLTPPFEWDSLAYHLPFAVEYLQEGAFVPWNAPFWTYPAIYEMLLAWNLLLFQGDLGVHLLNPLFLLFMVATLVSIGEKCRLSPKSIWLAILMFATCPVVLWQLTNTKNDLALSCFFAASLNALFLLFRSRDGSFLIPIGLGAGLLLGTKYSGIYYFLILAGISGWTVLLDRPKNRGLGLAGLAAAIVYGGTWYIRNYILTGNPVYPGEVRLAGYALFPAAPGAIFTSNTSISSNLSPTAVYHFGKMLLRWGAVPGVILLPGLYPFFLHAKRRGKAQDGRILTILWIVQIFCFISFVVHPISAGIEAGDITLLKYGLVLRYALPALGVGLFPILWSLDPWIGRIQHQLLLRIGVVIFLASTCINPAAWLESFANLVGLIHPSRQELSAKFGGFLLAGITGMIVSAAFFFLEFQRPRRKYFRMVLCFSIPVLLFPVSQHYRDARRTNIYQTVLERKSGVKTAIFEWNHTSRGRNMAVIGLPWYLFAGSNLENKLNYIRISNENNLHEQMESKKINTIILGKEVGNRDLPGFGVYPIAPEWIREKDFSLVYHDELVSVYNK